MKTAGQYFFEAAQVARASSGTPQQRIPATNCRLCTYLLNFIPLHTTHMNPKITSNPYFYNKTRRFSVFFTFIGCTSPKTPHKFFKKLALWPSG